MDAPREAQVLSGYQKLRLKRDGDGELIAQRLERKLSGQSQSVASKTLNALRDLEQAKVRAPHDFRIHLSPRTMPQNSIRI